MAKKIVRKPVVKKSIPKKKPRKSVSWAGDGKKDGGGPRIK